MTGPEHEPKNPKRNALEFLSNADSPVLPSPDSDRVTDDHMVKTQNAVDFFWANAERMHHFGQRAESRGLTGRDVVITLIDVDDPIGSILANGLMPGQDWQAYRDAGETPVARGLAGKDSVQGFLEAAGYKAAAAELQDAADLRVVVLRAEVALVLEVPVPA